MKILSLKVLRGPNYWSNFRRQLIEMKLDLEKFEDYPTNQLDGFNEKLKSLIPTLQKHRCSPGHEGGFFLRLAEGTWLGHVIEHVALEMQTLAGMDCGFGRTYGTNERGVYQVILAYEVEEAGLYAAKAAVALVQQLADGENYFHLEKDIESLKAYYEGSRMGPSTEALVQAAKQKNIPWHRVDHTSFVILGQGCKQRKIWATLSSHTSAIAVDVAANKALTKQILAANFIPVPEGVMIHSQDELAQAIATIGFPLVIKPKDANHGRGIVTNIQNEEKAIFAFKFAQKIATDIIVEKYINGEDYRFLVINYQVVAVAKRTPALVIGDGKQTVEQLIAETNRDPKRGHAHENSLTTIKIDEETLVYLQERDLSLQSIPAKGQVVQLKSSANISAGGTATDVTAKVHPLNLRLAERVARLIELDVCGIDIVAEAIHAPIDASNGAVIEVNAAPGLRMHLAPNEGAARDVATPMIDMLYPEGTSARIPIVAVTGTNGKTTVARLIASMAKAGNHHVGLTTTEGIYIDENLISAGDCSGPLSAQKVLLDPLVDFAVFECARGGILRSGLGFDHCDISIITNISADHLGLEGINTLEELLEVKSVVARSTHQTGYAILNADDDHVYALREKLDCHIALFAMENTERLQIHCRQGGVAAYLEAGYIIIQKGPEKTIVAAINDIPITFKGTALFMIKNILPAILAADLSNIALATIQRVLINFYPSIENTPGRMNIFHFNEVQVLIDYAHNEGAFLELKHFFEHTHYAKKIGIIAAAGDRRDQDIKKLGSLAGQMFDEIIIRHNADNRGKSNEQQTDLILQGIRAVEPTLTVQVISDEFAAIKKALSQATPNTLIFCVIDDVFATVAFMQSELKKFQAQQQNERVYDES